jgi:hypothetical protein
VSNEQDDRQTVAMCDCCGRGYMWVAYPEKQGPCINKQCRGRIRMLVTPEDHLRDDHYAKIERINRLREGGYVVELAADQPSQETERTR